MVKPQATAYGKAGMNCTGEHISTAAPSRRPDRRKGRSTTRRYGEGRWMHGGEYFLRVAPRHGASRRNGGRTARQLSLQDLGRSFIRRNAAARNPAICTDWQDSSGVTRPPAFIQRQLEAEGRCRATRRRSNEHGSRWPLLCGRSKTNLCRLRTNCFLRRLDESRHTPAVYIAPRTLSNWAATWRA